MWCKLIYKNCKWKKGLELEKSKKNLFTYIDKKAFKLDP